MIVEIVQRDRNAKTGPAVKSMTIARGVKTVLMARYVAIIVVALVYRREIVRMRKCVWTGFA